ncbi:MAG: hypothetical protein IPH88_05495 [Bacteroidales bacterium]|nr:hypothetical protein [Bacteroidales bacterium]
MRFKYALFGFAIFLVGCVVYAKFFHEGQPDAYKKKIEGQANPFYAPLDSSEVMWARAHDYIAKRYRLISGGTVENKDSSIFIPYYNDYHKGSSMRIERKRVGDSIQFNVAWWYSGEIMVEGSKEVALFMKKQVSTSIISNPDSPE